MPADDAFNPPTSMAGLDPSLSAFAMAGDLHTYGSRGGQSAVGQIPVEVLVEVFKYLDIASALSLAATGRRFASIFAENRASIVLSILRDEFSPLSGLLQVLMASPTDLKVPWGTWLDKRVRRNNVVLCEGGMLPARVPGQTAPMFIPGAEVRLDDGGIDPLLSLCRVVRGWERVFPQHRFQAAPLHTRSLTADENFRLRRALYHWMRYAFYFHTELPRPNQFVPGGRDVRLNHLRNLTNTELGELMDVWRTVQDMVELTLCPSIDVVRMDAGHELSEKDAARIGWGDQEENSAVVVTVCKLSPAELLYYLNNRHLFSKARLVQDIRQRHPQFERDVESLTPALATVIHERRRHLMLSFPRVVEKGPLAEVLNLPEDTRVTEEGNLDWGNPEVEAAFEHVGQMERLNMDWRPEDPNFTLVNMRHGLLDP